MNMIICLHRIIATLVIPTMAGRSTCRLGIHCHSAPAAKIGKDPFLIPDTLALTLNGGQGQLERQAKSTSTSLEAGLDLRSSAADISFGDYQFMTNLDLGVNIDMPSFESGRLDISGTNIQLTDARLASQDKGKTEPWNAFLSIDKGLLVLPLPDSEEDAGQVRHLSHTLKERSVKSLLEKADADFSITGKLSQLAWINLLFSNPYGMTVDGTGDFTAELRIDDGFPARDSIVRILPQHLDVRVLDYEVNGDGLISMQVPKGGEHPDLDLQVELTDALFRRQNEEKAYVRDVSMKLQAQALNMRRDQSGSNVDVLRLQIPTARITDWKKSVFVHAEAAVEIKDSRPFVAMFSELCHRFFLEDLPPATAACLTSSVVIRRS